MRNFIDLLESAEPDSKIDGSAFLYLSPKKPAGQFAQCATCINFRPESQRCGIMSDKDEITGKMSCGFYLHGKPNEDQPCRSIVTPKEAGLVDGPVRCRNCSWHDEGKCGLYAMLMQKMPDAFDLDPQVEDDACCNAFQAKV